MCIDELCKIYNKNIDDSVNKINIWIYVDESPNHNSGIYLRILQRRIYYSLYPYILCTLIHVYISYDVVTESDRHTFLCICLFWFIYLLSHTHFFYKKKFINNT